MTPVDLPPVQPYTTDNRRPRRSAERLQADGVFRGAALLARVLILIACLMFVEPAAAGLLPVFASGPPRGSPAHTPTPAPHASCGSSQGRIEKGEIEVAGQPRPLPFRVYLPPCYDYDLEQLYPVLYLLHGLLGTDAQWEDLGAGEVEDQLLAQGAVPPFLIVMPWERTGLTIEAAIVDGLIGYIDQTYRTRTDARWRAIGGISRGGGQALEIGLLHPELFGQVGLHSPAVLHGDVLISRWLTGITEGNLPAIWIDIGSRDSLFDSTAHLIEFFFEQGIAPTIQFNAGDHEQDYWESNLPTYLRWHGGLWRMAEIQDEARARTH